MRKISMLIKSMTEKIITPALRNFVISPFGNRVIPNQQAMASTVKRHTAIATVGHTGFPITIVTIPNPPSGSGHTERILRGRHVVVLRHRYNDSQRRWPV